jgi:hypothetical protein
VAERAGVDEDWVIRFAAPVLAEQARVVDSSLPLVFSTARRGSSAHGLGQSVRWNLADRGVLLDDDAFLSGWSAFQLTPGRWVVRFEYSSRGRGQVAEWEVDLGAGELVARNKLARELGLVEPGAKSRVEPEEVAPPRRLTPARQQAWVPTPHAGSGDADEGHDGDGTGAQRRRAARASAPRSAKPVKATKPARSAKVAKVAKVAKAAGPPKVAKGAPPATSGGPAKPAGRRSATGSGRPARADAASPLTRTPARRAPRSSTPRPVPATPSDPVGSRSMPKGSPAPWAPATGGKPAVAKRAEAPLVPPAPAPKPVPARAKSGPAKSAAPGSVPPASGPTSAGAAPPKVTPRRSVSIGVPTTAAGNGTSGPGGEPRTERSGRDGADAPNGGRDREGRVQPPAVSPSTPPPAVAQPAARRPAVARPVPPVVVPRRIGRVVAPPRGRRAEPPARAESAATPEDPAPAPGRRTTPVLVIRAPRASSAPPAD